MTIGTRSILYGAHQFLVHPFFVAWAWIQLYGFRRVRIGDRRVNARPRHGGIARVRRHTVFASIFSPRLWLAFVVHDIGYLGKPNMDGAEGELHPLLGARIMDFVCGAPWGEFTRYHSRYLSKRDGARPSALCAVDKLATVLMPRSLYLSLARGTGELREYMSKSAHMNETGGKYAGMNISLEDEISWHRDMTDYMRRWIAEHKDGRADTWTKTAASMATAGGAHGA